MNDRITSDEVANQLAKAIQLMLEWTRQEILVSSQVRIGKSVSEGDHDNGQISPKAGKLLKIKEVAEKLQVSRSFAYQMIRRGEIPTIHFGSAVRVQQSDLDVFIKQSKES
jgi:excisionase family DNA binding protein